MKVDFISRFAAVTLCFLFLSPDLFALTRTLYIGIPHLEHESHTHIRSFAPSSEFHATGDQVVLANAGHAYLGGHANDPSNSPSDDVFQIELKMEQGAFEYAFLTYEVLGVANAEALPKSVNGNPSYGSDNLEMGVEWQQAKVRIDKEDLREGVNHIRFMLPSDFQYPVEVRNVSLEITTENASQDRIQEIIVRRPANTIDFEVLSEDVNLMGSMVTEAEAASIPRHIFNVTRRSYAYHLEGRADQGYHIAIGVDASLVRSQSEMNQVQVFYFDDASAAWKSAHVVKVDHTTLRVEAMVPGETDYFAGMIQTPEMPEAGAFVPTNISDIEPANPATGMRMIQAPTANRQGSANVSYPLWVPQGRNGMSPQLALSYNSDGSSGWCGLGWGISIPSISIDTKLGVPRFDATSETEAYVFNGEELFMEGGRRPNRADNGGNTLQRQSNGTNGIRFYPRTVSSYSEIIRHGSQPDNYYWVITDADNRKYYYGTYTGTEVSSAGTLASGKGIATWYLTKVEDKWGNTMTYDYQKSVHPTSSTDLRSGGTTMNISQITYTGYAEDAGAYSVHFISSGDREDARISMNLGLKVVDDRRLDRIEVKYNGTDIVHYHLRYNQDFITQPQPATLSGISRFFKTLLTEVAEQRDFTSGGADFYAHQFDYYQGTYGFNSTADYTIETEISAPWLTNSPEWAQDLLSPITSHVMPSGINTSITGGFSGSGSVGVGHQLIPIPNKSSTLTARGGYSNNRTWATRMFQDVSGDGLPDLLFRDDGEFQYRPLRRHDNGSYSLGNTYSIHSEHLQRSNQTSVNMSLDFIAELKLLYYGSNWNWSSNETSISMTDYNADGIPDLLTENGDDYRVKFGFFEPGGDLNFSYTSEATHNPVLKAEDVVVPDFEGVPVKPFESVRVWEASKSGTIQIRGTASIYGSNSGEVRVAVQKNGQFIYTGNTFGSNGALAFRDVTPASSQVMSYDISVQEGDQIFFRIQAGENGQEDFVQWNPVVKYTNSTHVDGNGTKFWQSSYNAGFLLSGREPVWFSGDDFIKVVPNVLDLNAGLSDDIQLKIELFDENGQVAEYIEQVTAGATTVGSSFGGASFINNYHTFNGTLGVSPSDELYMVCSVWSPSTVDWKRIKWRPEIHIKNDCVDFPDITYPVVDFQTYNRIEELGGPVAFSLSAGDYEVMVELDDHTQAAQQSELETIFDEMDANYSEVFYLTIKSGSNTIARKAVSFDYVHGGTHQVKWYDLKSDLDLNSIISNTSYNGSTSASFNSSQVVSQSIWVEFQGKGLFAERLATYLSDHITGYKAISATGGQSTLESSNNIYYRYLDELQSNHKYWGQFGWSAPEGDENVAISPSDLTTPAEAELNNGANFDSEEYLSTTTADLDPMNMKFFPMFAIRGEKTSTLRSYQLDYAGGVGSLDYTLIDRWSVLGSHISVFNAFGMSFPGIFGEMEDEPDAFTVPGGLSPTYTASGIPSRTKSYSKAVNGPELGGGVINTESSNVINPLLYFSRTVGYFGDLNGDGYPDVVSENDNGSYSIQYTNPTGGHEDAVTLSNISRLNKAYSSNYVESATTGTFVNAIVLFEEIELPPVPTGSSSESFGNTFTLNNLTDVNGDGLSDNAVSGSGIMLNSGYGFESAINAPYQYSVGNNTSEGYGVSSPLEFLFGENTPKWAKSFSAGVNVNFVGSEAETFYMDFNGDGLQDRMEITSNSTGNLYLNTGTSFQLYNSVTTEENMNLTRGMGFSGNLTGTFAFPIAPGTKMSVGGGVNGNLSVNRVRTSFVDLNGDGAKDFIQSLDNGNMDVYLAKSAKANLLKSVTNPLGGSITVDYELIGNKVGYYSADVRTHVSNDDVEKVIWDMPNAKWVMSQVTISDGVDLVNSSSVDLDGEDDYVTRFAYDGGIRNRREKKFVGFTRVATIQPDQLDESGMNYLHDHCEINGIAESRPVQEIDPSVGTSTDMTEPTKLETNNLSVTLYLNPSSLDPADMRAWTYSQDLVERQLTLHRHYWKEVYDPDLGPGFPEKVWYFEHIELVSEKTYDYEFREVDTEISSSTGGQVKYASESPVVIENLTSLDETSSVFPAVRVTEDVSFPDVAEREKYIAHKFEIEYDEYFNVIRYKDFGASQPGPETKVQIGTYTYYEYKHHTQENSCNDLETFPRIESPEYAPFVGVVVESDSAAQGYEPDIVWYIPEPIPGCLNPEEVPYPNAFCAGEGDNQVFMSEHRLKVLREVPIYEYTYATVYTGALIAEMDYFDPANADGRTGALKEHKIYEGSTANNPIRHAEVSSLWSSASITNAAPSQMRQYYGLGASDYSVADVEYDDYGNVTKITGAPNDNSERAYRTFTYDGTLNQFVEQVTNNFGESVCNMYDFRTQNLNQTVGPNGHPIRYIYDDNDRMIEVWAPRELYDGTVGPTISFEYYPYGKTGANVTDPAPLAITYHNTGNTSTSVNYRDITNLDQYCETLFTVPSSAMSSSVGTATFVDGMDRPIQIKTEVDMFDTVTGISTEEFRVSGIVEYDRFGHEVTMRRDFISNESPADLGNLVWDVASNISPVIGTSEYDYLSRKHSEEVAWSGTGTSSNVDFTTITYGYNWNSDLTYTDYVGDDFFTNSITQDGTIQVSYTDSRGNSVATKSVDGANASNHILTQFDFDNLGQLEKVITPMSTSGNPIEVDYTYDMLGRVLTETHPDRGTTTTEYDDASNVTATITPEGRTNFGYDFNRLETKSYVEIANPTNSSISAGLYDVLFEYGLSDGSDGANAVGRVLRVTQGTSTNPVLTEEFKYDELGASSWNEREFNIPKNGTEIFVTQSNYDSFGRVLRLKYPDDEFVSYTYSDLGNLESITTNFASSATEVIISMIRYDGFDNILKIEYGNGTTTDFVYHEVTRSLLSNATQARAHDGTTQFTQVHDKEFVYNSRGLISSVDANVHKQMYGTGTNANYTFSFTYDKFNRLTQADLTDDNSSTLAYTVSADFDAAGRITGKTSNVVNPTYLISSTTGLNYDWNYSYQAGSHQLDVVADVSPTGWHQNYQFNDAGSIEEIEEWNTITSSYESTVMVWNEDQQLVAVSDPTNGIHHYVYDYNGERIMKSSYLETSLSINDQDVGTRANLDPYSLYVNEYYVRTNFADGFQKTKHYYMGMQRVVTDITVQEAAPSEGPGLKTDASSTSQTTEATHEGQLAETSNSDNPVLNHLVHVLGELGKVEGEDYTLSELQESPSLQTIFPQYASSADDLKVGDYGGEWECCFESIRYWYHPDYLGSVDMITDEDGVVYQYFLYNPWGEQLNSYTQANGEFSSPYRFNGKELDEETGLAYYGARYYDNKISMWLSVDAMAAKGPNISPYTFSHNNPIILVDPDGNWPWLFDVMKAAVAYIFTREPVVEVLVGDVVPNPQFVFETEAEVTVGVQAGFQTPYVSGEANLASIELYEGTTDHRTGESNVQNYIGDGDGTPVSHSAAISVGPRVALGPVNPSIGISASIEQNVRDSNGLAEGGISSDGYTEPVIQGNLGMFKAGNSRSGQSGLRSGTLSGSARQTIGTEFHGVELPLGITLILGIKTTTRIGYRY